MRHRNQKLGLSTFALLLLPFTQLPVQAQSRSADYAKHIGNEHAGAEVRLHVGASYEERDAEHGFLEYEAEAEASMKAEVQLLGARVQALSFEASTSAAREPEMYSYGSRWSAAYEASGEANADLRVLGIVIFHDDRHSNGELEVSDALGPWTLFPGGLTAKFMAGFIPITLSANAGAEAELGCTLEVDATNVQPQMSGYAEGGLFGTAGVHAGFACLSLSSELRLEFGSTRLEIHAHARSGAVGGELLYEFTPLRILLTFTASACVASKTWVLVDLSSATISGTETLR